MVSDVYAEEATAMVVGIALSLGGTGLWVADLLPLGWLLIPVGGAVTGYLADTDGFRVTGLAVIPLVVLGVVAAFAYVALTAEFGSLTGGVLVALLGVYGLQIALLVATPFVVAGGVGGWLSNQVER
jgi:hypothetical protein